MRCLFKVLALVLAAVFAAAESELAHSMEMVYMYSKYQTEGVVFTKGYWIAPDCAKGLNRRCSFNEFASYIKYGNRATGPVIIELNGAFNWADKDTVQKVVTTMSNLKDPTDPRGERLFMAGDLMASRVNSAANGVTSLFNHMKTFDKETAAEIAKMPDGPAKTNAKAMLDASNDRILKAAEDLRTATRRQKLHDEMTKKFSPTGKLDRIYEYEKDGKTQRFDPIQWDVEKYNLFGRDFQKIRVDETKAKNPQLNDPILWGRVEEHLKLFNSDGSDGKGKGLIVYDVRYAGTNGRHQHIINTQEGVRKAYALECK